MPTTDKSPSHAKRWVLIIIACLILGGIFLWPRLSGRTQDQKQSQKKDGRKGKEEAQVQVVAVRARTGSIAQYFNGLGTVTPLATVIVRSRVDGQLMRVQYREGDDVTQGDTLVEIDPRPFQVQLEQTEAQQAKDQALLDNSRVDLDRYEMLLRQKSIAEQQVVTQRATVAQNEASVKADKAQVDAAQLNLTYAKVTAPITGRIGLRLVDPGNIVHASDSAGLLVITQMDPISVIFTVAENQLPTVLQKTHAAAKLPVAAFDRDMKKQIAGGTLTTIDNQIDQTTGTVRMRATFDNKRGDLFPNEFVNARLLVNDKKGVVLIPSAAIQRTTNTTFIYLVGPDNKVKVQNVGIGIMEGDDAEITSGLKAGDVVVLTGVDQLEEGTAVNPQIQGEDAGKAGKGGDGKATDKGADSGNGKAKGKGK